MGTGPAGRIGQLRQVDKLGLFSTVFQDVLNHAVDITIDNRTAAEAVNCQFLFLSQTNKNGNQKTN